jgi:hypothetical protein
MIWDFPTTKYKTIDDLDSLGFPVRRTIITRSFWIRIIWGPTQKTILLGRHRINFTYEPDASEHMDQVQANNQQEWWEK